MATFSTRDYSYGELSGGGSSIRVYGKADVEVSTSGANYTVHVRTYCMGELSAGGTYINGAVNDPYAAFYPVRVPDASNAVTVNRPCETAARGSVNVSAGTQILAQSSSECTYTGKRSHSQEKFKFTLNWSASKLWLRSSTSGSISKTDGLAGGSGEQYVIVPPLDSYTVSYDANGGSGAPAAQTKWYGENLALSSARPTRVGYTFRGWGTAPASSGALAQPGDTYTANSPITLYAQWTQNVYTVTYDAHGGTGAPSSQSKLHGETLHLSESAPTRNGYAFLGWSTRSNGAVQYKPGGGYSADASATLYAVWAELYDVTYAPNGNEEYPVSEMPDPQVKQEGTDLKISSVVPSRPGFAFRGWATSATSATIYLNPGGTYRSDADITLYAVWVAVYDIAYSANAEDPVLGIPDPQVKYSDSDIVIPNVTPTRQGWLFSAWSLEPDRVFPSGSNRYLPGGTLKGDFEDVDVNRVVTLYAIWKQTAYGEIVKVDRDDADSSRLSVEVKVIGTGTLEAIGLSTTKTTMVTEDGTYAIEDVDTSTLTVTLDVISADGLRAPTVSVTVPPGNVPALSLKQDAGGMLSGMGVAADAEEGYLESSLPMASTKVISSDYMVGNTHRYDCLDQHYDGRKSFAYDMGIEQDRYLVIHLDKGDDNAWWGSFEATAYLGDEYVKWAFSGYHEPPGWANPKGTLVAASDDAEHAAYLGCTGDDDMWAAIPLEGWSIVTIGNVNEWGPIVYRPVRDQFVLENYQGVLADLGTVQATFARTRPVRKDEVGTAASYDVWGTDGANAIPAKTSVPVVKTDGGMEIGRFLDFHSEVASDFDFRIFMPSPGTLELSGALLANGRVAHNQKNNSYASSGGAWITGKDRNNCPITFDAASVRDGSRYDPYMWGRNVDGDVWNFGAGASNEIGFWGFHAGRTDNGTDWRAVADITSGNVSCSGSVTAPSFDGTVYASKVSGTLPISHGGTGGSDRSWALNNLTDAGYLDNASSHWDGLVTGIYMVGGEGFSSGRGQPQGRYQYGTLIVRNNGSNICQIYVPHDWQGISTRDRWSSSNGFSSWAHQVISGEDINTLGGVLNTAHGGTGSSYYPAVMSLYTGGSNGINFLYGNFGASNPYIVIRTHSWNEWGINVWSSDRRVKDNIEDSDVSGLEAVNAIRHRSFDMRGDHVEIGYVAQELEGISPDLVLKVPKMRDVDHQRIFTGDYSYQVDERGLIPRMTKAIQELSAKVSALEAEVKELREMMS